MNHVTYQMAITRHQELVRQAAQDRLAKQTLEARQDKSGHAVGHARRRLEISTKNRYASR